MKIEPPKTIEDYKENRGNILRLMDNEYCDLSMFLVLAEKLYKVNHDIKKLRTR